jgi:peroxin-2
VECVKQTLRTHLTCQVRVRSRTTHAISCLIVASGVVCVVCFVLDCGHLFCYYCIKTAMMVDRSYACPSCNHQIKQIKPFTLGALSASATDVPSSSPPS